jgi:mono/diheme cytochrome c family protein
MISARTLWTAMCIAACAALMVAAAPASSSVNTDPSVDLPVAPIAAADGKAIFMKKCKKCHGPDGKADTKMGKKHKIDVIPGKLSKAKIVKIVKNGIAKTKMKSFSKKLSAEEIDAVAGYVKTL